MKTVLDVLKGVEKELAESGHDIVIDSQHFIILDGKKVARIAEGLVGDDESVSEEIADIITMEIENIINTLSKAEGLSDIFEELPDPVVETPKKGSKSTKKTSPVSVENTAE